MLFGKKRKDALLIGVDEIDKTFRYVRKKKNENKMKQRIRHRFAKHETVYQLKNVFVFDLETNYDQNFAGAYAAGFYDVNRLRDM